MVVALGHEIDLPEGVSDGYGRNGCAGLPINTVLDRESRQGGPDGAPIVRTFAEPVDAAGCAFSRLEVVRSLLPHRISVSLFGRAWRCLARGYWELPFPTCFQARESGLSI